MILPKVMSGSWRRARMGGAGWNEVYLCYEADTVCKLERIANMRRDP